MSETTIFNLLVLREGREKKVFRPQEFYLSNFRVKAGPDYMISLIVSLYSAFVCGCLMRAAAVETTENMFFVISKHQIWAIEAAKV